MELKEYLQIIKKNLRLFLAIIIATIVITMAYFHFQPTSYETSLILNITRTGSQETNTYQYDDFYRLQADERFADTVVQWLHSPRIVMEILNDAKIDTANFSLTDLAKRFSIQRKSSQIVAIDFSSVSDKDAQKISDSIVKSISQKTEKLNTDQKEAYWFAIAEEDPITLQKKSDYKIIFLSALLAGVFLAFWLVMIKHYLE